MQRLPKIKSRSGSQEAYAPYSRNVNRRRVIGGIVSGDSTGRTRAIFNGSKNIDGKLLLRTVLGAQDLTSLNNIKVQPVINNNYHFHGPVYTGTTYTGDVTKTVHHHGTVVQNNVPVYNVTGDMNQEGPIENPRMTRVPLHPDLACDEEMPAPLAARTVEGTKHRSAKRRRAHTSVRPSVTESRNSLESDFKRRILENLLSKEEERHSSKPLQNHEITSRQRSRMIDWMIEVFSTFKKEDETYFLAVYIFDDYLSQSDALYEDKDVHLIGISCIFTASKVLDLMPIIIEDVADKIGHNAFGEDIIKENETGIIRTFGWDLDIVTPIHFIDHFMHLLKSALGGNEFYLILSDLEKTTTQFAKMAIIDDKMLKYRPSEIAIAAFASACDLMYDSRCAEHTTKMQKIYGFFQDLLTQDMLRRKNCIDAIDYLKKTLSTWRINYRHCPNCIKFSLVGDALF